jgi:hypothetical protein
MDMIIVRDPQFAVNIKGEDLDRQLAEPMLDHPIDEYVLSLQQLVGDCYLTG